MKEPNEPSLVSRDISRRVFLIASITAAAGAVLVGCSGGGSTASASPSTPASSTGASATSSTSSSASTQPAGGNAPVITMNDQYQFVPNTITVAKGTTIEWHNTSASPHTVTDDPAKAQKKEDAALPTGAEAWDSDLVNPGQTFKHTFSVAGDYSYFCIPHESMGMVGKITVK